ncbi:MAG: hypothetical protein U9N49_00945, partial [Campylobacterota bacterium]|nr:hypothetical protein [Campylobacterota bacterium]
IHSCPYASLNLFELALASTTKIRLAYEQLSVAEFDGYIVGVALYVLKRTFFIGNIFIKSSNILSR